jgi:hypothetical protein
MMPSRSDGAGPDWALYDGRFLHRCPGQPHQHGHRTPCANPSACFCCCLARFGTCATASTYTDVMIVERDLGRLTKYTFDMGGTGDLLSLSPKVPPWENLHELSPQELQITGLVTTDVVVDVLPENGLTNSAVASLTRSRRRIALSAVQTTRRSRPRQNPQRRPKPPHRPEQSRRSTFPYAPRYGPALRSTVASGMRRNAPSRRRSIRTTPSPDSRGRAPA